jgi:hypothetical protein
MNQMTPAEITAILKAHRKGKPIEMNALYNPPDSGWIPCSAPHWDFTTVAYRVYNSTPKINVVLNSQYSATIDPVKREIKVGCVMITSEKIEEILKALGQEERKIYVLVCADNSINASYNKETILNLYWAGCKIYEVIPSKLGGLACPNLIRG